MIRDVKLELTRRLMSLLVNRSKGDTYQDKLETSYKTNLLVMLLLTTIIITGAAKVITMAVYSNDIEQILVQANSINEDQRIMISSLIDVNKAQQFRLSELNKEAELHKAEIEILVEKLKEYEKVKK